MQNLTIRARTFLRSLLSKSHTYTYLLYRATAWTPNTLLFNTVYRHLNDGILAGIISSYSFPTINELRFNIGSFRIASFGNDIFLDKLQEALEGETLSKLSIIFGPALYVENRSRLFKILSDNKNKVRLYFREDFDDNGWDEKHFRLFDKTKNKRTVVLEARHTETSPDTVKKVDVISSKDRQTDIPSKGIRIIDFYNKKWDELITNMQHETIQNIIEKAFIINSQEDRNGITRFKGLITSSSNTHDTSNIDDATTKDNIIQSLS